MAATHARFEDADNPGREVVFETDPQIVVNPGSRPGTAIVVTPDGKRYHVVGDYQAVHARIQDKAARAHESGDAPRANTGVS